MRLFPRLLRRNLGGGSGEATIWRVTIGCNGAGLASILAMDNQLFRPAEPYRYRKQIECLPVNQIHMIRRLHT